MGALIEKARNDRLNNLADALSVETAASRLIKNILTLSPFLRDTWIKNPNYLCPLLEMDIETRLITLLDDIAQSHQLKNLTESKIMSYLRLKKREAHSLIALADLGGIFTPAITCLWLSRLAEKSLNAALQFLLREAHDRGKISLNDYDNPEKQCGLIVLGMGKLGAEELNYSSDIDLIVFIDETSSHIGDPYESVDFFSKMMRRLVRIMQERTADGYVFRVDMRLRPDPGATPLAIPVNAALHYYEARGQNWERAAMIKARPVAGDIDAGQQFLKDLSPFIWRKYLDYATIADVHSIKRQIHAHKGLGEIAVKGHNVKLGRGGIREIEFFVQTQQLIAGGRFPQLQGRKTEDMLNELVTLDWLKKTDRDILIEKYWFLRNVEHRIQMLADEPSHILPEEDEHLLSIVRLMGYSNEESFKKDFLDALRNIETHYAALFETENELGIDDGNLVFTGDGDDPESLKTLARLGFDRPHDISRIVRTWHFGRYRVTQSSKARAKLTELIPLILKTFGASKRADEAFMRFDRFLQGLPSGVQLFSLLQSNPYLLNLCVTIMSAAPRLAESITRRPHIFDALLDPTILTDIPVNDYLQNRLENFLVPATRYEDILDQLRIFADEQRFYIGARLLTGVIDGVSAGRAFSDLADLMIINTLKAVEEEFIHNHGIIKDGRIVIFGMGKLGSHEMTASSDVDLILLYDFDKACEMSNGNKPLYITQYYTRLTQRLIAALSAPTAEGILYQVDLRLRPSGNKGPVAVSFDAFSKYQRHDAWVWEHLALTRGRVIAGDLSLKGELEKDILAILGQRHNKDEIAEEVIKMRALIEREKPPLNQWDLKLIPGGLIDLEFIAQYFILTKEISFTIGQSTFESLKNFSSIDEKERSISELSQIYRFFTDLTQLLRLCLNEITETQSMPSGLLDLLQKKAGEPDLARVESLIQEKAATVRSVFQQILVKTT
ncbi:hypothetical protein MEG_00891 [Bartonella tamiae Th307]|uniref:Bifunctional glutamine synthetase adenylyltransferase/adenylyl-removing enzyme n=2 Tax=Bartonella tamiae TaxID=373638 RepID=J0R4K0_9HYPH|nr:hypothetical protein ME5_00990 [Bartonella tamiae Th239]EJF94033.1 hypothetical protein MEG_00891 [Bartonella tamiae Th307]